MQNNISKLTLKISDSNFVDKGLENYLSTVKGIILSKVDNKNNKVYIQYNSNKISINIIKMEILLYLSLLDIPSIIAFNKHPKKETKKHILTVDLCCEYCLMGMIDDLLQVKGIESAYTDFDYITKKDVNIYLTYDNEILSEKEINEQLKKIIHE